MKTIKASDFLNMKVNDWESDFDMMSGTLSWSNKNNSISIFATPDWEDDNKTTFAISDDEDNYSNLVSIIMEPTESIEFQKEIYIETLKIVIKKLQKYATKSSD